MWQCKFCGGREMWFDRSIEYHPDGTEVGMVNRCCKCGQNVDDEPKCLRCGSIYDINFLKNGCCATCGRQINEAKIIKNNFEEISKLLLKEVAARFNQVEINRDVEFGDSFAELLEKLLIVNIRMWKLEDLASQEKDDKKLGELKRKIDFCFKEKRPKLIKAINSFLDTYITNYRKFFEENIKSYG